MTDQVLLQLWRIFESLPTRLAKDFSEQRKLQKEYLEVRQKLNTTSSQDEFAKWAKLRRTHDKLLEQLEKKSTMPERTRHISRFIHMLIYLTTESSLEATKTNFDRYVTGVRWASTRGLQWFLPFWYAKEPMFWLPYGWFPYYVEWLLSFPRAPLGSVSIAAWQMACTGALTLAAETITAILGLIVASRQKQGVPVASGNGTDSKVEEKKDL